MEPPYPDDDDGEVLRRVAAEGADMSRPMTIDYTIYAADIQSARALAERIAAIGYTPRLYVDDVDGSVSLYCARHMVATYDAVIACQEELNELCHSVGATCDGWLTAGNRQGH
jgi:Regulator of ribonuclease activity B